MHSSGNPFGNPGSNFEFWKLYFSMIVHKMFLNLNVHEDEIFKLLT